jgi:hypothetical protein
LYQEYSNFELVLFLLSGICVWLKTALSEPLDITWNDNIISEEVNNELERMWKTYPKILPSFTSAFA